MCADSAKLVHTCKPAAYYPVADLHVPGKRRVVHEASMVKVFCTEMASRIADMAMDIFGTEGGFTRYRIEQFLRDIGLYRIFEGTSETQRMIISRNLLKKGR